MAVYYKIHNGKGYVYHFYNDEWIDLHNKDEDLKNSKYIHE